MSTVDQLVARTLGITEDRLTADLAYQSVREWDSLGHVALMVALEQEYGVEVDDDLMLELRTLDAVRAFADGLADPAAGAPAPGTAAGVSAPGTAAGVTAPGTASGDAAPAAAVTVHRGLEGVTFDHTAVTLIDGAEGTLEYRGYSIHDLAEHASFEEVAHLLVHGHLPDAAALEIFTKQLRAARTLPAPVLDLARALAHAHPMEALRTCVSALGAFAPRRAAGTDESLTEAREAGIELIARVPMIVAAHHAFRSGREPLRPREDAGHAEAFLTVLLGEEPTPAAVRVIDKGFVVHADHGSNASAFTARVAIGCRADITAALTAAIAAFSGSVHGGAAERAITLVDEVGTPENAEAHVAALQSRGEPVMGFGHRVYRTEDPRMRHLRASVVELSEERGDRTGLDVLDAVAAAMRPRQRHGVAPNVDLYAGLSYRLLGLPDDLAVALFVIGRTAGWVAQALEQHANNVLIRPLLAYAGPRGLTHPSGAAR
ncbi:citrate/2-methylcitrate synthase [Streptomyces roseolus]|uniref:citrate/2-methylcitrate synthase n=1 Tax=Streptomyces roseolus TaxID=67358 RepID=UPI0016769ACA|nr:citrate/2-methylcitrate synthase [Streptomyces roseolus]GGR55229.1 citrate synthase [Streptomyces roseolus]